MTFERRNNHQQQPHNHHEAADLVPTDPDLFPKPTFNFCITRETLCLDPDPAAFIAWTSEANVIHPKSTGSNIAYLPDKILANTVTGNHVVKWKVLRPCQDPYQNERLVKDTNTVAFCKTDIEVAVKVFTIEQIQMFKRIKHAEDGMKEISAMQLVGNNHSCLMGCKDVLFDGKNIYVVMQFCSGGELFDSFAYQVSENQMNSIGPGLSEQQIHSCFRSLVEAVQILHSKYHICHR